MSILPEVIDVPYRVKFTNKNPIPIEKLVESLIGYEKLLKRVGPFIEASHQGFHIDDIEVLMAKIEAGSLTEDFIVRLIFKDAENYAKAKEVLAKMLENNKILTGAVVLGVAAYIGFGIQNALISEGSKAPTPHIEAQQGAIVQLGGTLNISDEAIKAILYKTLDKKRLTKEALAAISPAHLETDASVEFNESKELQLTPDFIKEAPEVYVPPEKTEQNDVFTNIPIEIWASDKDSFTRSWAGVVPGKIDKRVKFELDEVVDPNQVHGHRSLNADIVIVSSLSPTKKEFVPTKVKILRIHK